MRTYVATSGALFGLLALAHVWRVAEEGRGPTTNPWFIASTLVAAGLSVWAFRLLWLERRSRER